MALNQPLVCEVVIGLGSIPLAKYGTPGTPELTEARTADSSVRRDTHVKPRRGHLRRRSTFRVHEDGTVEHFAQIALVTHCSDASSRWAAWNWRN